MAYPTTTSLIITLLSKMISLTDFFLKRFCLHKHSIQHYKEDALGELSLTQGLCIEEAAAQAAADVLTQLLGQRFSVYSYQIAFKRDALYACWKQKILHAGMQLSISAGLILHTRSTFRKGKTRETLAVC
jgi:hypothetical protein